MILTMFLFRSPGPTPPRASTLDIVVGPNACDSFWIPNSCCKPSVSEYIVAQFVLPFSGHRSYPATPE